MPSRVDVKERRDGGAKPITDADSLAQGWPPLHELNERCLDLLARMAGGTASNSAPELIQVLRGALHTMRPEARHRAAASPFLLLDLGFCDSAWWSAVKNDASCRWQARGHRDFFAKRPAIALTRALLMLAWHQVRSDPNAAVVSMGISLDCAHIIRSLRFSQIDQIAEHQYARLRPRWEDKPIIWTRLLSCCATDDRESLRDLHIHAIQLLSGELVTHLR